MCAVLFLSSCNYEQSESESPSQLFSRQSNNMTVSFITLDQKNEHLTTSRIEVTYLSNNTIALKTNAGLNDEQTYYTTSFSAAEPDTYMKVILNPGSNQTVYTSKYSIVGSVNDQGIVSSTILSGSISSNSTSIIIEESDTL